MGPNHSITDDGLDALVGPDPADKPSAAKASPAGPADTQDTARPPPIPGGAKAGAKVDEQPPEEPAAEGNPDRRVARRRPAGPSRSRIAANDDAPSIGGLIYALNQRPSNQPYTVAIVASLVWALLTLGFAAVYLRTVIAGADSLVAVLARFETLTVVATLICPIGIFWLFAYLAQRGEELRLRSNAMTEVAIRLAEPDRMAEQSVASLGQAVRRQVNFMNDAVARALGRAGELEALVHNEVSALERSYEDNERKIRSLIQELAGERDALLNTSGRVTDTLKVLGDEVPALIDKLSHQQLKLAEIIEGAGENLTALESAIGTQSDKLESTVGERTHHLEAVLDGYREAIDATIAGRTENIQTVFEEYARALDTTLANRAEALDIQLVERTRALDEAFMERLQLFDESILRSTMAVDGTISEKAMTLSNAMDTHARNLTEALGRQAMELDENLMHGINAVRRTSESIARQSIKAIEGLAGQSDLLKRVSENLLTQITSIANRFENQGSAIMYAANALESVNYKIDKTLQNRHVELNQTLDRLTGKADELNDFMHGYSRQIESSVSAAEQRTRALTADLTQTAEERSRSVLSDLERLKSTAAEDTHRALEDLRSQFTDVSREMSEGLGSLSSRFTETSQEMRQRAAQAAAELASEQERLRAQIASLPQTTREGADALRKSLQDQLRALEQLSSLTRREASARDVSRPFVSALPGQKSQTEKSRALSTLSYALAEEMQSRGARPQSAGAAAADGAQQRDGWSLGDLLKRASRGDEDHGPSAPPAPPPEPIDIGRLSLALDANTASEIWARLGAGQRGFMVRSIYPQEGRALFDEVSQQYSEDAAFQRSVGHFFSEFERTLQEAEQHDPTGRSAQAHLMSEEGRVYLFLAHVTGRLG
jgi:ABC-type transporter Mla subunit MlaD